MIPIKLTISGFLSYLQPVELDFSEFDVACISGSNGAGKSSLLDAITWVLFGRARHRDDSLLINSHAATAEVTLEFEYEGNRYRISRSKSREKPLRLEFQIFDQNWKTITESTLRETEASINKTLRMDYDTFINASFFLQGKADLFAQQKPGDRKKILSNILGLEIWENYREFAVEKRRMKELELSSINRTLDDIDTELSEEGDRVQRLAQLEESLSQANALRKSKEKLVENIRKRHQMVSEQQRMTKMLGDRVKQSQESLHRTQERLKLRETERLDYEQKIASAPQIEDAYLKWLSSRNELEKWEKLAESSRKYQPLQSALKITIEKEQSRLDQELQNLRDRENLVSELEKNLPEIQAKMDGLDIDISAAKNEIARKSLLEEQIRSHQDHRAKLIAENTRLKSEMGEVKERIDHLQAVDSAECPLCGQELNADDRQSILESLQRDGKEKGDQFRRNLDAVNQADENIKEAGTGIKAIDQLDVITQQKQRLLDQLNDQKKNLDFQIHHWKTTDQVRLKEIKDLLEKENFALEARRQLAEIEDSLIKLGYDSSAHDNARRAEQQAHISQEKYNELENARAALAPLMREIESLREQVLAEAQSYDQALQEYRFAIEKLDIDQKDLPDIQLEEHELLDLQEKENRLRTDLGGAVQRVKVLENQRKRRLSMQIERDMVFRTIGQIKSLERAFGKDGVPALLIEQALPEIEIQANEILSRLSSGRMGLRFATQKDYKDHKRDDKKETLDILISDAAGIREYDLFSGGESFRVNFAIRLALSRVLAKRAGARLQTLVIDEGFGSQDAEGLQRLIESINIVRTDFAKVLVISHLEEMKDSFPARIEVEKTIHGSTLRVMS